MAAHNFSLRTSTEALSTSLSGLVCNSRHLILTKEKRAAMRLRGKIRFESQEKFGKKLSFLPLLHVNGLDCSVSFGIKVYGLEGAFRRYETDTNRVKYFVHCGYIFMEPR
jgi:hypothetical protein